MHNISEIELDNLCKVSKDDVESIEWDETGAKYSKNGKILLSCRVSLEGNFIVPNGVEVIAENAFKDCINIESIEIPDSVIKIGHNAFCNCKRLSYVSIPDNNVVEIAGWTFSGCIGLKKPVLCNDTFVRLPIEYVGAYSIPQKVTKIADGAFDGCAFLTSVDIPDNVSYIGDNAFKGCLSLPNPIYNKSIFAFMPLYYQSEYKIPSGIKEIAGGAFRCCRWLTTVEIPDGLQKIGAWAFFKCERLNNVTIPNTVKEIGNYAFQNCHELKSIVIPDNIKIGDNAFKNCGKERVVLHDENNEKLIRFPKSFKGVFEIPHGIKDICEKAFYDCHDLTSIIIPDSVQHIGKNAFGNCIGLRSIDLPDSVTSVETDVFAGCLNIEKPIYNKTVFAYLPVRFKGVYTIPPGITALGSSCFKNCKGLTRIELPDGLLSIRREAFANCSNLKEIKLPVSLKAIMSCAFAGCLSIESIKIPDGVSKINKNCFKDCSNLRFVLFPDTLREIDAEAFSNCVNLESLDLPNGLTKIGLSAFEGCTSLTCVTMPEQVKGLYESAFKNCSNLQIIYKSKKENNPYLINSQCNKPLLYEDENLSSNFIYINEYRYSYLNTNKLFRKRKMLCQSWNGLAYRKDNSVYIINPSPFVVIKLEGSYIGRTLLNLIWQYKDNLERFPYYYDGSEISSVNLDSPEFFTMFIKAFPRSYMSSIINYRRHLNATIQASFSKNSIFRQWLMEKKDNNYPTIRFYEKVSALSVRSNRTLYDINKEITGETGTIINGEIFTLQSNVVGYCKLVFESMEIAKATIVANVPIKERFEYMQSIKEYLESNLLHKRSNSRKDGKINCIRVIFINHDNFEKWKIEILNY